jgi:hypothetical protein
MSKGRNHTKTTHRVAAVDDPLGPRVRGVRRGGRPAETQASLGHVQVAESVERQFARVVEASHHGLKGNVVGVRGQRERQGAEEHGVMRRGHGWIFESAPINQRGQPDLFFLIS